MLLDGPHIVQDALPMGEAFTSYQSLLLNRMICVNRKYRLFPIIICTTELWDLYERST